MKYFKTEGAWILSQPTVLQARDRVPAGQCVDHFGGGVYSVERLSLWPGPQARQFLITIICWKPHTLTISKMCVEQRCKDWQSQNYALVLLFTIELHRIIPGEEIHTPGMVICICVNKMERVRTRSLQHGDPLPACISPKMIGKTDAALESCITVDTNLLISFKPSYKKKKDRNANNIYTLHKINRKLFACQTVPIFNALDFTNIPTVPQKCSSICY